MGLHAQAEGAVEFSDQANISTWAQDAVTALRASGIIGGHPDGSFRPQQQATRAEAAVILDRVLE